MYVLAHAAVPVIPFALLRQWRPRSRLARLPLAWLALGGLLPDLVDKPLGHLVLGYGHGRLWLHTLMAVLALTGAAAVTWPRSERSGRVLGALAGGVASHVVLDAMWNAPVILLWPLLGPMPHGQYDPARYLTVLMEPSIYVSEGIAAVLLMGALLGMRARRNAESRSPRTALR